MITIKTKQAIFELYFISGYSQRKISSTLNISRNTVHKIIQECKQKIFELDFIEEADLMNHISKIIVAPTLNRKRKPYKIDEYTLQYIKKIIIKNEQSRYGSSKATSIKELYEEYLNQDDSLIKTNISMDSFYKYAKKFKEEYYAQKNK
ncbi:sigma factor-like helix-turn-helix DNA-binding protein [Sedimentibacter saalensis]|uniref:Homeodomain-like domain-containing protein n=1 Tax=Sedimentibacter saalensis TaxID=130788 RepID=A0A562JH62_9FIRM|nr:sigma factor-like helix-turn-helix DNA-binding protein [Sedimentibacter saalensis]TWH82567.1 Homeodomain-like domain-containing protein [Sedimentibacter saalensis]